MASRVTSPAQPDVTPTTNLASNALIDLAGTWTVRRADQRATIAAQVPGCIHADLLRLKKLPALNWRDNELQHRDAIRHDWVWERSFSVTDKQLRARKLWLRCAGLDTLAEVAVNGTVVITADNMFRTWEADVGAVLKVGTNRIVVTIRSPIPLMQQGTAAQRLMEWNVYETDFRGRGYVRKQACSFGWDWGPCAPSSGIWRAIGIHAAETARISDVRIEQQHVGGAVTLSAHTAIERWSAAPLDVLLLITKDDAVVATATAVIARNATTAVLNVAIAQPELWWPNGLGAQPLYSVHIAVAQAGETIDVWQRRIGLRQLELVREADRFGESFAFRCNGVRFFAKGANWIPNHVWPSEIDPAVVRARLHDAADCHMNMLRCWGGGIYEIPEFYDTCDERGLLVWQDLMFACGAYPGHLAQWRDNVVAEVQENVRALRHHACIALWCGNNEIEQGLVGDKAELGQMPWADYRQVFDEVLARAVKAAHPDGAYWPCSPHSPTGDRVDFNNPASGDAHCWDVWFGGIPFEGQRNWQHRFQSEFGFQSFPEPRTVAAFTAPEDRNLTSRIMDFHQRSVQIGNKQILRYLLDWFRLPSDGDDLLWATQIVQGLCIQFAAEHTRRQQERMEGCLYWQLNDRWPAATWSSIDHLGRWKALQYMAGRFFAPILVSGVEQLSDSTVAVHLSNQRATPFRGEVRWRVTDAAGKRLASGKVAVSVVAQTNAHVATVACEKLRHRAGTHLANGYDLGNLGAGALGQFAADGDTLVWLEAYEGRKVVSRNVVLWARPKHLALQPPRIRAMVTAAGKSGDKGSFIVSLNSRHPALWTRLELADCDARWSDNFVHLDGQSAQQVTVRPAKTMTVAQVRAALRVRSVAEWA